MQNLPDASGHFDQFGGQFVPEALHAALVELAQAFTEEIWREGIGKLNPFDEQFVFRSLDRGGEPFERAHTGARRRGRA